MRSSRIISHASRCDNSASVGSMRSTVSFRISAVTPPMPGRIAVPSWSRCRPTIISTPLETISCTRNVSGAKPVAASTSQRMRVSRAPISSAARPTATPPISLLCVMRFDSSLSTTRLSRSRAGCSASAEVRTTRSRAGVMPKRSNSAVRPAGARYGSRMTHAPTLPPTNAARASAGDTNAGLMSASLSPTLSSAATIM